MSHIIKTKTPFISKDLLIEALDHLNIKYKTSTKEIILERQDYSGNRKFIYTGNTYSLQHDSYGKTTTEFLIAVTKEYQLAEARLLEKIKKAEEEKLKKELERLQKEREELERRRLEVISQNKKIVLENAKKKGYQVKETKNNGKTTLVLIRRTY